MSPTKRLQVAVLFVMFFSGASALVYEVVWQKMLGLVFGSTTFATATILATFMCGLALGSWWFGRFADRHAQPLKIYALLEAGIGVYALLVPLLLSVVTAIYVAAYRQFHASAYVFNLLKFVLCFLVLVVPSFLLLPTS